MGDSLYNHKKKLNRNVYWYWEWGQSDTGSTMIIIGDISTFFLSEVKWNVVKQGHGMILDDWFLF